MEQTIDIKTSKGVFWQTLQGIGAKGIEFIVQIILARILMPDDFGVLAILAIFSNLASTIVNNGLTTSLLHKKNATQTDYSTVFYLEFSLSLIMYAVLFFLAPLIANYYENADITQYLRIYSLVIIFSSISSIQTTVLRSRADFKTLFIANIIGVVVQAISGICLAKLNFGVWSLVISQVLYYGVSTILLCILVHWIPKGKFSIKSFWSLFKFSWKMTVGWIIGNVYNDLFSLIVGKRYNDETLGYYSKSQTIPSTVNQIVGQMTSSVMFPAFAKIQDDRELVKQKTSIMIAVLSAMLFPIMAGIAGAGEPLISIILTDKWLPCVPMMQIVCISFALSAINNSNMQSITGIGRSDLFMIFELIKRGVAIVLVIVLAPINIYLMIWSIVFVAILSLIMNGVANKVLFKYSFKQYLFDIVPYVLYSLGLFAITYFMNLLSLNKYILFFLQLLVCVVYYFTLIFFSRLPGYKVLRETINNLIKRSESSDFNDEINHEKKKFNFQITGLRAFFCVFIMLYHFLIRYFEIYQLTPIMGSNWIPDAIVFVGGFFVLSGMFLNIRTLKKFWKSKLLKIFIPSIFCMLIIFGVMSICQHKMVVSLVDLLMNCLILPLITGQFTYVDGAHWYIVYMVYIFIVFSVFYAIAFLCKKRKIIDYLMFAFGIGIFVVALIPASDNMIYKLFNIAFNNRLVFIVLGYFLNKFMVILQNKDESKKNKVLYTLFLVFSVGFSLTVLLKAYFWINTIYFAIVFGIIVLCLVNKLKFLEWKPLIIIGNMSLWIYLLHQNIGYLIIDAFNGLNLYWLGVIIAIITILIVSYLFSFGYDKLLSVISKRSKKARDTI